MVFLQLWHSLSHSSELSMEPLFVPANFVRLLVVAAQSKSPDSILECCTSQIELIISNVYPF